MHKQNIKNLDLSCEEKIFELISIEYLNKSYNEVHRKILKAKKYENYELNIILYKPLQHIKDKKTANEHYKSIPRFSTFRTLWYQKESNETKTSLRMEKKHAKNG